MYSKNITYIRYLARQEALKWQSYGDVLNSIDRAIVAFPEFKDTIRKAFFGRWYEIQEALYSVFAARRGLVKWETRTARKALSALDKFSLCTIDHFRFWRKIGKISDSLFVSLEPYGDKDFCLKDMQKLEGSEWDVVLCGEAPSIYYAECCTLILLEHKNLHEAARAHRQSVGRFA